MNSLSDEWKRSDSAEAHEEYDPELLLNSLMQRMHLTGDSQLAKRLRMDKRLLGQVRERRQQISGSILMQSLRIVALQAASNGQFGKAACRQSRQ